MTHPHLLLDTDNVLWCVEGLIPERPINNLTGPTDQTHFEIQLSSYEKKTAALTKIKVGNPEEVYKIWGTPKNKLVIVHGMFYPINARVEIKEETISCPDGIEGCEVLHKQKLAFLHPIEPEKVTSVGELAPKEDGSLCGKFPRVNPVEEAKEPESQEKLWKELLDRDDTDYNIELIKEAMTKFTITRKVDDKKKMKTK